jgi:hypothetical protein
MNELLDILKSTFQNFDALYMLHEFLAYLYSEEGKKQIFSLVLKGGLSILTVFFFIKLPRWVYRTVTTFLKFRGIVGGYFLYSPPTASGISDAPRRTILRIRFSLALRKKAVQYNERPFRKMYAGNWYPDRSLIFCNMEAADGVGQKMIVFYDMKDAVEKTRGITVGVMVGMNENSEPWRVPVIITKNAWPSAAINEAFASLRTSIISRRQRRSVIERVLHHTAEGRITDLIAHPWGMTEVQTYSASVWNRVLTLLSNRRK